MHSNLATRKQAFADPPAAMMRRLDSAGFNILPVGNSRDPKAAVIPFTGKRLSVDQAIAICHKNKSGAYGVRCDQIVVVDFDEYKPDHIKWANHRFGEPSVTVFTARGVHAYYKRPDGWDYRGAAQVIKDAGVKADLKFGGEQYVIGAQSCRMDGAIYHPQKGDLPTSPLAPIDPIADIKPDLLRENRDLIRKGERHTTLTKIGLREVGCCATVEELTDNLIMRAQFDFEDPQSFGIGEIEAIAFWVWRIHVEGRNSIATRGHLTIRREDLTMIGCDPDALYLYSHLVSAHGNRDQFILNYEAMRKHGLVTFSRQRFKAARDRLQNHGLLHRISWPNPSEQLAAYFSLYPGGRV